MTADPILEAFETRFREYPDQPLLVSPTHRATVAEVETLAQLAQSQLESIAGPLNRGTPIGLAAANGSGFLAGLLALRRLGLPAVLLEAGRPAHLVQKMARSLDLGWVLSCSQSWPGRGEDFEILPIERNLEGQTPPLAPEIAVIKLTSGSTGKPRGVVTSSSALVADDRALAATMGLRPEDRVLASIPFSHSYGLASIVLPALMRGSVLVLPQTGNPFNVLRAGRWGKATFFPTIPAWVEAMVKMSNPPALPPTLRLTIYAGAPLEPATAARFHQVFGQRIHVFYGSSESGGISFDRLGDGAERGSLGTPVEGVRVTLEPLPAETGDLPKAGESSRRAALSPSTRQGLVTISSPAVAQGYWPRPDPALEEGRFRTQDLAEFRGQELFLMGRVDDLINVKGKKVNPREIEAVLRQLPGVEEVAVLGVPKPKGNGDLIRAFVVTKDKSLTYDDLHGFCRSHLPDHKVPRSFLLLPSLPVSSRGKLDRAALRDLRPGQAPTTP
ncbi:MAG: fatty acid--CoA ligase family protein [Deltaproteobacteria bacterium]|nr:fatty acid--CoA ligase family protein [Deltaproteobacteria bacterium]